MSLALFAACAPVTQTPEVSDTAYQAEAARQRELVYQDWLPQMQRLTEVSTRLLSANADLCGDNVIATLGSEWGNKTYLGKDFEDVFIQHGIGDGWHLISWSKDSPVAAAGLKLGDKAVAINGWQLPDDAGGYEGRRRFEESAEKTGKVTLTISSSDGVRDIDLPVIFQCPYHVRLVMTDTMAAAADGQRIIVTSGMMRFAESNDELAVVVGHEIAHNLMGHIDKKRGNQILGALIDAILHGAGVNTHGVFTQIGAMVFSQDFEREADYVGLYLMARAGYPVDGAANLWRRIGVAHPGSISANLGATHPPTPERFLALEQTAAEIAAKQKTGQPLAFEFSQEEAAPTSENPQAPWN